MYYRWLEKKLKNNLKLPYIHILLGARQTGKSTLINKIVSTSAIKLDFSNPALKSEYSINPELFIENL